ncbi:response regulator [Sphingomonas crocodyli]|uniref:Response regulator n=1 Tax=Sphingomonas crocodyli TaxID=1979270 RepID=A0A437M908_9SPHN|nr:response regulator [Sphingomonas crocodyli]RVT94103.1 response regulator [Sphingomonas crocodyli]
MSLGQDLAYHLPFLRRYARALSGSQTIGDRLVKQTLAAIVADQASFPTDVDPRLGLYAAFLDIWEDQGADAMAGEAEGDEAIAHRRLARITPRPRQALLLTEMEGFTSEDAAYLMDTDRAEVETLVADAVAEIERQTHARVLIIEDEPIIAMDIEQMVSDLGHDVCAIATTHSEAVAAARAHRPTLVLADVQLADDSCGIEAVKDILTDFRVPTIFITAFPERLLTGDRPEPAFLITKPFQRSTVKAAIAQALFFDDATVPA